MNRTTDLCWMIGGPQGTGVDSSATLFARSCAAAGYWIYGRREYHSNIKGEHSYFQVRVKRDPVHSHIDPVHLLATFEDSTAKLHAFEVVEDGAFIYDPKVTDPTTLDLKPGVLKFPIAFEGILEEMAQETGKSVTSLAIMKNTVAVAASLALCKMDISAVQQGLEGIFTGSKSKLVGLNMKAATRAYEAIQQHPDFEKFNYVIEPPNPPGKDSRYIMNAAAACALGKIKAGCRVQTYYSITPAVDECIYLEEHPDSGIAVIQCEDELSAINMAIGAATTGMRASTSTSGPGFSLMAEGMGWAGINEVPVVVYNYQRGGPSTGLPTRHEQADLLFAIHTGHGEYPKIVIAPGDLDECFYDSFDSFNYAERYQTPVIFICDKLLANNTICVPKFDESEMTIDRGELVGVGAKESDNMEDNLAKFPRFQIRENTPISPRALPGTPGHIYWMTGDEHTEFGHITEEPEIRIPMHDKRMRKLDLALAEIPQDKQYLYHNPTGSSNPDLTILSWGSTKGVVLDAIPVLKEKYGIEVAFLQIRLLNPFPTEAVERILTNAKRVVAVESSYGCQIAQLVRMRTSFKTPHEIVKYSGRPISETELVAALKDIHENQTGKVELSYGL